MLGFYVYGRIWILCILSCVTLFMIQPSLGFANLKNIPTQKNNDPNFLFKKMETIKKCDDPRTILLFLFDIKNYITSQGYECPSVKNLLNYYRNFLETEKGIAIDDQTFQALNDEVEKIEGDIDGVIFKQIKHSHHKKNKHKKDKEISINGKTATGFLKFVGGSLLALIPVPFIQTAGVTLAIIGVNDMVDGSREESEKRDAEERFEKNRRIDQGLKK